MPDHSPLRKASQYLVTLLDETPGAGLTRRQIVALATVWAACTLLLLLLRPGYGFPPFRVIDGWIYTAYQWDLANQIKDFGPTYYGSRLSWILPGALLHAILPHAAANLTYKILVSAAFAVACATIVRRYAGLGAALLAVALSVLCPHFILALHSDYIDTAVIVYGALALACITAARDSRRWPALIFLGGCFYAGMVIANLSALASVGAGIAVFHLGWLRWSIRRHLASVVLYALAALGVCVVLGLIHRRVGGEFNFLQPQIGMLSFMRDLKTNPWIPADRWWFVQAPWLVVPAGILLWGGYQSCFSRPPDHRLRDLIRALTAGLATSFAVAFYLQASELNATLSFAFYASFHLCLALPLAACLTMTPGRLPAAHRGVAATLAALLLVVFFWDTKIFSSGLLMILPFVPRSAAAPQLAACLLLAFAALVGFIRHRSNQPWLRFLRPEMLLVGLVACSVPFGFHGPGVSDRLRERYETVHAAYRTLAREFPADSYRFWVHPDEDNGISLASTKLWGFRLFSLKRFPEFDAKDLAGILEQKTLIVPSPPGRGRETLATATRVLHAANCSLSAPRVIEVRGEAGLGFDLTCFSVQPDSLGPEPLPIESNRAAVLMDLDFAATQPYTLSLGINIYGPKKGDFLDASRGYPVFTRTDPADHLATPFYPLRPARPGETRQLTVIASMPADGHCLAVIQIDDCVTIAQIKWTRPGRFEHKVTVPAGATSLRLYLQSSEDRATPLPTRITVYCELPPGGPG